MYQPSIRCQRCPELISVKGKSISNWMYELCERCLHQCVVCGCLVNEDYQCNKCKKYICFVHIAGAENTCYNCMPHRNVACGDCDKLIVGCKYEYMHDQIYCDSCAPRCYYNGCDRIATSWRELCDRHDLYRKYPMRSIFHPFINVHHVATITTILMAIRKRVPRPIAMMIIDRAFNN